jgi:hypothetical protein
MREAGDILTKYNSKVQGAEILLILNISDECVTVNTAIVLGFVRGFRRLPNTVSETRYVSVILCNKGLFPIQLGPFEGATSRPLHESKIIVTFPEVFQFP